MKWMWKIFAFVAGVGIGTTAAQAQVTSLKSSRFGGVSYVAISDVAAYYGIGRDLNLKKENAEYRSSRGNLSFTEGRRNIEIDGVAHWMSAPVLNERDRLWISSVDALKVIDPILRGGRTKDAAKVRTIVLDPGHGGADRGTRGVTALEKTMTLDLALRLERLLEAEGFRVLLTRRKDSTLSLDDRVEYSRDQRADLFLSLHFNAGGSASGIETYCLPPGGAPSTATTFRRMTGGATHAGNRYDGKNAWLAHCIQKALIKQTGTTDRGVRRGRFLVLCNVKCPSILVECGFLSNRAEEKQILSSAYREKLAKAICEGVLNYRKTAE